MTNPNNAVGTNAAYDGRTSVNAFNDDLTIYSRGILSGWGCSPKSGMTVTVGGNGTDRDAAVAEDNAGNKTSINNISGSPIDVTIPAAPSTNSRIDLIVAYADNPPTGVSTVADNPAACGIIVVSGTAAANPTQPTNATIRSAITTDGATGATAYYVILAKIRVGQGVTTIGSGVITQGDVVTSYAIPANDSVTTDSIADDSVTESKIDWSSLTGTDWPVVNAQAYNYDVNSNSWYDQYSYTVPQTGVYLIIFDQRMTNGLSNYDFNLRITHNSNTISQTATGGNTWNNWILGTVSAVISANASDTIKCQSSGGGTGSYQTQQGRITIVRLH